MIARPPAHAERLSRGAHRALVQRQGARRIVPEAVAARLRFQGQRERRIGVDVDGLDGVHLDRDAQAHGGFATRSGSSFSNTCIAALRT